jgi:DNA-binding HxlR family transcriptional regulator
LKDLSGRQFAFREISTKMSSERIKELEKRIAELQSRWPAHSVPPTMLQQLEELEEELEKELKKTAGGETSAQADGPGGL